ncbi:MAG: hypothetical protein V1874_17055 [Spirochaetota bacterium]
MKKLLFVLIAFIAAGCSNILENVKAGSSIANDKIIIVGKVNIVPKFEQFGDDDWKNKILLFIDDDEKEEFTDDLGLICDLIRMLKEADTVIKSDWDDYFIVELPRKNFYLKGVYVVAERRGNRDSGLLIRSNIKIDIKANDRFIYIGDLNYIMNKKDKYELQIVNNYDSARKKYEKYFSNLKGVTLQNRILINKSKVETFGATCTLRRY